ncbi:DUF7019 family protein [Streptomyces sp. NPDC056512]|uniref:DUF7019 family protein n=1 Tax=Streptomyces sp. NPDC056512 TaxID=3345846 RepID=UPI00367379F0
MGHSPCMTTAPPVVRVTRYRSRLAMPCTVSRPFRWVDEDRTVTPLGDLAWPAALNDRTDCLGEATRPGNHWAQPTYVCTRRPSLRPSRRPQPPLRYFLYVSDVKLDMLYEQIDPAQRRRVSAEVKVDLKLASMTLKQADEPQATRLAKLRMVERYIDTHHHVGTIHAPGQSYFRGSMPMRWGWLWDGMAGPRATAFFKGREGSDVVVLAGSRRHVLGSEPEDPDNARLMWGYSSTPAIMAAIWEHVSALPDFDEYWNSVQRRGFPDYATPAEAREAGLGVAASVRLRGPAQHLEFLALPLAEDVLISDGLGRRETVHAVLATPIYVALVGPSGS